jgi:hypothetical protein
VLIGHGACSPRSDFKDCLHEINQLSARHRSDG